MIKNAILLLLFFVSSVQAQNQETFETKALDDLMLKTCSKFSTTAICQNRMSEIRQGLDPAKFISAVPKLNIDSKIQIVVVDSSLEMATKYYCLAQFNRLIPTEDFEPAVFSYAVRGFSFSKESEKPYARWLNSSASKRCREHLAKIGLKPSLIKLDQPFQLVLNPVTFFEAGAENDFFAIAGATYNHERLHAIFSEEKAKSKTIRYWKRLSKGQQEQFRLEHPSYDFKNMSVLAREFFSYTFESDPAKAYDFLKGKYDQVPYEALQKQLCTFCIHQDPKTTEMAKMLIQLDPKALLAYVEKEGIKVLILTSGRKNPSPLFNWGKVRIDKGELNQITKLEGAMGKTLCLGERPESHDAMTIVLGADSPYSTLVHEYLHILQIRRDGTWCPVSKQLWGKETVAPWEQRMIRDREWDVRIALWSLLEAPHMTVEDRLMITDGLINEATQRMSFDPSAATFVEKNGLKEKREKEMTNYIKILNTKN